MIVIQINLMKQKNTPLLVINKFLSDEIAVMDSTAIALCKDNNIPIMVFDIFKKGEYLQSSCWRIYRLFNKLNLISIIFNYERTRNSIKYE